jgi:hypothetical protein
VTYSRSEQWRIKRSSGHLDKALDSLTRAKGELRPLRELHDRMDRLLADAESLYKDMRNGSQPAPRMLPIDRSDDGEDEPSENPD